MRKTYYPRRYYRRRTSYQRRPRQYGMNLSRYIPATGQGEIYRTIMHRDAAITTNVGGTLTVQLPFNGVSASGNWSSLANVFDEFRVEGIKIDFTPGLPNSTSATFPNMYVYFDLDGLGTVSLANALSHSSCQKFDPNKPWTKTYSLPNNVVNRSTWFTTSSPGNQLEAAAIAMEGASISTTYGTLHIAYYIAFRGQA